jgi:hypothetical protein
MHGLQSQFELVRYSLDFGYNCHSLDQNHILAILE